VSLEAEKREFGDVLQQPGSVVQKLQLLKGRAVEMCVYLKTVKWYKAVTNTLVLS